MSIPILSILIPARNEEWLGTTVEDILSNLEADTEIIVLLDGYTTPIPPIPEDPRVILIRHSTSIGQRAGTNEAARLSQAKYLIKVDAHCKFDKGFDRKMIEAMQELGDNVTMAPMMKNLHIFDWVCPDGHRRYQSPSGPCETCQKPTVKELVWKEKKSPNSFSYCFDSEPHFQYHTEFEKRPEAHPPEHPEINESMSLQGSCFICTREKYWELDLCSESFPSWGSQGIEVACKTWLSGGRVLVNRKTWYAHCFRTRGGDFGFPYPMPGKMADKAKAHARDLFFNNQWPQAIHPLSWLVEKFWPVKGWTDADLAKLKGAPSKGIIFYTDCRLEPKLAEAVKENLKQISKDKSIPIVSSSLKKIDLGKNIHFPHLKRGYFAMAKQIYAAIENSTAEWIFFCEHDVMYHTSHFDFIPPTKDKFYYNRNFWKLRSDGHAVHFDADQLSGLCAHRDLLLVEYKKIMEFIEKNGFSYKTVSFEPGTRDGRSEWWKSEFPIVDVRHGTNLTPDKWKQEDFRDKSTCTGWEESDMEIPGWGSTAELVKKLF